MQQQQQQQRAAAAAAAARRAPLLVLLLAAGVTDAFLHLQQPRTSTTTARQGAFCDD